MSHDANDLSPDNPYDPCREYGAWDAHEEAWLNRGWRCALLRRLAWGRWGRRFVLWLAGVRWIGEYWRGRAQDALYPSGCSVAFLPAAAPAPATTEAP